MTPGVTEWLALLRAHEGGLTKLNNGYLNHGRPVAGYLADALETLIRTEQLALGAPSPSGQRQVRVTHAGQARFAQLCNTQRSSHNGDGPR